jgi:LysR family transcriptional regulator, regulator of abg operon
MKFNQFRNIAAIAERGGLRAAARHLGLAQPALSRSVQEIEHELGVQLFERGARGMRLTPVGEAFVRRINNVLTEVRRARDEVEQLNGGTSGNVTVALSIVPHLAILPRVLGQFRKRYPRVQLRVIEGLYPRVEADLKSGVLDFYVGPPPEQHLPPQLIVEKIFENERKIFCRKGHPLADAKSLSELVDAEWLTTSITYSAEEEVAELFERNRLPMPRLVFHSQSALTMMIALANTDLIAMIPKQWSTFPFTTDAFATISIKETLVEAPPITMIKRAGMPLTPAAEYLAELVRRYRVDDPSAIHEQPAKSGKHSARRKTSAVKTSSEKRSARAIPK